MTGAAIHTDLTEPCDLKIGQFTVLNMDRAKRWHKGGTEEWSVTDWFTATTGELGEAANAVKKLRRVQMGAVNINEEGRHLTEVEQAARVAQHELADTFIYMVILSEELRKLGAPEFSRAIRYAFNRKSEEYGFPERVGQHSCFLAFDPDHDQAALP